MGIVLNCVVYQTTVLDSSLGTFLGNETEKNGRKSHKSFIFPAKHRTNWIRKKNKRYSTSIDRSQLRNPFYTTMALLGWIGSFGPCRRSAWRFHTVIRMWTMGRFLSRVALFSLVEWWLRHAAELALSSQHTFLLRSMCSFETNERVWIMLSSLRGGLRHVFDAVA